MFGSLLKAVVGACVETPIAIIADTITLGGLAVEREEPFTMSSVKNVVKNLSESVDGLDGN